jgi:hypothetical protein
VTDGLFFVFALLAFAIIVLISSMGFGSNRAFGYASFVGMVGAIFLATLNLMTWWIASAFILSGLAGLAFMIMSERD